jgi:hypothetical protein
MIVGYEIKAVVLRLKLQMLPHCPKKVANMQPSGRLYA